MLCAVKLINWTQNGALSARGVEHHNSIYFMMWWWPIGRQINCSQRRMKRKLPTKITIHIKRALFTFKTILGSYMQKFEMLSVFQLNSAWGRYLEWSNRDQFTWCNAIRQRHSFVLVCLVFVFVLFCRYKNQINNSVPFTRCYMFHAKSAGNVHHFHMIKWMSIFMKTLIYLHNN